MQNKIINKIISEFESELKIGYNSVFEIPIIQNNDSWDIESAFHYSEENGISEFVENEGNKDVSEIIKKGNRTFIIFEYFRNPAPNLPARKIYMGEIIEINSDIKLIGSCKNFTEYANEKHKFIEVIEKLSRLIKFRSKLIKEFAGAKYL